MFAFLKGALSEESRTKLEGHLSSCGTCSEVVTWAAAHIAAPSRTPGREGQPFVGQLAPGTLSTVTDPWRGRSRRDGRSLCRLPSRFGPTGRPEDRFRDGRGRWGAPGASVAEARAVARLSHPNVVTVHDAGTFADRVYIAMEFVDGRTLDDWLAAEVRTWREILNVFLDAGRGWRRRTQPGSFTATSNPRTS